MIQTGHGRPRRLPLAALVLLTAFLAVAPSAPGASRYGNVVEVLVPRPAANQVVLARVQVDMGLRRGFRGALGSLNVRRDGRRVRLRQVRRQLRAGRSVALRLKVSTASRAAARRSLTLGRRLSARVTVRVRDGRGNLRIAGRSIRLRR